MTHSAYSLPAGDPNMIARRLVQSAHNRDGLPEIAVGLSFLIIGSLSYAEALSPPGSIPFKAAGLGLSLLIPILCIGSPVALKWVRRRFLIHRVGYVQSQPIPRKQRGIRITLAIVVAVALLAVVTQFSQPDRWILAGTGLFGGALMAMAGQLPRFIAGGLLMATTGIIVAFSGVSLPTGFAILFGLEGLVALVSGCVVFSRFVREPIEPGD